KFSPKEVALNTVEHGIQRHWLIRPPFPFNKLPLKDRHQNTWLTFNYHGLKWTDGSVYLLNLIDNIKFYSEKAHRIYVRGAIKAKYLEELLQREIINLEEPSSECPKFENLEPEVINCAFHGKTV
ncbi:GSCOCG00011853001-RA-CDS, partial [Cotesia congregata]